MKNLYRMFNFNIGLLYPSVLGSIIYILLSNFSFGNIRAELAKHAIVFFILVQYVFDYLYTNTDEIKVDYSKRQGICDFLIIVSLFISVNAASEIPEFLYFFPYVPLLLAVSKLLALFWELFRAKKDQTAIVLFGAFGLLYAVIQLFGKRAPYPLLAVLILDSLAFLVFGYLRQYSSQGES